MRRTRALGLVLIGIMTVSVLITSSPEPAVAQKYVPRKVKIKARKLLRKGRRAYKRKRFQKAVKYFLEAFKVWPRRELNFNISIAYGRLGDKINAVIYIRRFEKDASARELRSIPKWLREIKDEVAVVNVQGPDGSTIKMDGKVVGTVPSELVILPGMHLFVIIKPDGKRFAKRDWDVKPGLRKVWEVVEPRVVPVRPPTKVIVHRPITQPPPPPARKTISKWYTLTAIAVAAAVAGAAIGTGMMAKGLHEDYVANPTRSTREDGILMVNMTNALWGVSGVLLVGSVVLAVFTKWKSSPKESAKEKASTTPRIELGVGQGGASVSVTGRF
jgi:F0F1-type ATP synthase membrane subunit c/vacuolar-type H+-ATPase subunit K